MEKLIFHTYRFREAGTFFVFGLLVSLHLFRQCSFRQNCGLTQRRTQMIDYCNVQKSDFCFVEENYFSVLVQSVWSIAAGSLWFAGRTWLAGMVTPGRFAVPSGGQGFKIVYGYSSSQWQVLLCFCLLVRLCQTKRCPEKHHPTAFLQGWEGVFLCVTGRISNKERAEYLQQPAGQKNCQKHRCGPPCSITSCCLNRGLRNSVPPQRTKLLLLFYT